MTYNIKDRFYYFAYVVIRETFPQIHQPESKVVWPTFLNYQLDWSTKAHYLLHLCCQPLGVGGWGCVGVFERWLQPHHIIQLTVHICNWMTVGSWSRFSARKDSHLGDR